MDLVKHVELPVEKAGERRIARRQRVLKNALIVFNNGHCTMGCQIVDISETGAKLMPVDIFLCPKEFVLKSQFGEPRHCEVVWRKGTAIGVRYLD
ncbi:MAG: PilZ domain-containing protein [Acidobacteriaceae bacterium]|nr:PilZ domain-containing protein [Acidobacteriota bacterium]MBV8811279.1 PilZ domain-containing protein [Acidobacteriaceae bacterium]